MKAVFRLALSVRQKHVPVTRVNGNYGIERS